MVKITSKKIQTVQRDKMKSLQANAGPAGYNESLNATGTRFSGRPSAAGDRQLMLAARDMAEPDWSKLRLDQLVAAEKMALHRLSGGEAYWRSILERIRIAIARVS